MLLRECVTTSTVQGQTIPRGTQVILCPWAVNRSTELWGKDANEFTPQRWIDGEGETAKPNNHGGAESNYSFLTFLQGPRRCIGETFSRSELKCLIAALVGNFRIEMMDERPVVPDGIIGLKPKGGLYIKLTALEP